jgi:hypothetical protein
VRRQSQVSECVDEQTLLLFHRVPWGTLLDET